MPQAIDHIFLFIQPDGPEIDALQRLGLVANYRRAHPGQGTANVCFAFDNLYLELLWLTDEAEARGPAIARTRLWERGQWPTLGSCPFGLAVRGELAGLPSWGFRPPYLPPDMQIAVARASDDPVLPMVFVSPGNAPPLAWPAARRGGLQTHAGWGAVLSVELGLAPRAAQAPLWAALPVFTPPLGITQTMHGQHSLRIALADARGRHSHTLDLVSLPTGQWHVSLVKDPRP